MDVRQLRYFLAVVNEGGVHRAADALFVAQPSVSQAIRTLEHDLGSELFHRTGRRLVLTSAGESLLPVAREVLHQMDLARATVDAVNGLVGGTLALSSMPSQSVDPLAQLVGRFLDAYPGIRVIARSGATLDDVAHQVLTGDAELGIVARPLSLPAPTGLVVRPLTIHRFLCVARSDSALPPGHAPLRADQLAGARLIVGQSGTGMRRAADILLANAPGSEAVVEIEHREGLLPLVLAGVGIAIVAESWRHLAMSAGLVVRELETAEALAIELVHRPSALSPAAREFVAMTEVGSDHLHSAAVPPHG